MLLPSRAPVRPLALVEPPDVVQHEGGPDRSLVVYNIPALHLVGVPTEEAVGTCDTRHQSDTPAKPLEIAGKQVCHV